MSLGNECLLTSLPRIRDEILFKVFHNILNNMGILSLALQLFLCIYHFFSSGLHFLKD